MEVEAARVVEGFFWGTDGVSAGQRAVFAKSRTPERACQDQPDPTPVSIVSRWIDDQDGSR